MQQEIAAISDQAVQVYYENSNQKTALQREFMMS